MAVSKRTLRVLSALVWYTGGLVLLYTGSRYLLEAAGHPPGSWLPWVTGAAAAVTGALRGRRAFARGCRTNLARIEALETPRVWQFFRPGFFLALAAMIAGGAGLRALAEAGGFWGSLVVGSLELVIAVALLTSSVEFWRRRPAAEAGGGTVAGEQPGGGASGRPPREAAGDVA